jgi:hypothetical protein
MQDALKPIPQPYKTWVARSLFPFFFAILVPYAAVVEAAGWCKEQSEEVKDAWNDVTDW